MEARIAVPEDAPTIAIIYNERIADRIATFETGARTPLGTPLTIATLSWARKQNDTGHRTHGGLKSHEFLKALRVVCSSDKNKIDLVLCSGRTLTALPRPGELTEATSGTPVLFEASGKKHKAPWILFNGARLITLRWAQVVGSHSQKEEQKQLSRMIAEEQGVIRFNGVSTRFVLLICGENNCLNPDGKISVLRNAEPSAKLPKLLSDWVVLNPAHGPYWPQIKSRGFVKIGQDRQGAGPTLKRLIQQKRQYKDGTRAPTALIHCNNYDNDRVLTRRFASRAFGPCTHLRRLDGELKSWLYVPYLLALP